MSHEAYISVLRSLDGEEPTVSDARAHLHDVVAAVARFLPAQGPIRTFIHHNTLHALEHESFESAIERAHALFGAAQYAPEDFFRARVCAGQISAEDVEDALTTVLGGRVCERVAGVVTLGELWRAALAVAGLLPGASQSKGMVPTDRARTLDREALEYQWRRVREAGRSGTHVGASPSETGPRAALLEAAEVDVDAEVTSHLIRFCACFLDQGLATLAMPHRAHGMHRAFLALHRGWLTSALAPWGATLRALVQDDRSHGRDAAASLCHSLERMGVGAPSRAAFILETLMALPGYAGMIRQLELRPDRCEGGPLAVSLMDFLAVRALLERGVLEHAARQGVPRARLAPARERGERSRSRDDTRAVEILERAGVGASALEALDPRDAARLCDAVFESDVAARGRVMQEALERRLRQRLYRALSGGVAGRAPMSPSVQVIFCIDDREESLRRHLEEIDPSVETLGVAGFFGVAIYYQGPTDARPRPSCPVGIVPQHFVADAGEGGSLGEWSRRGIVRLRRQMHASDRAVAAGTLVTAGLGPLAIVPLVARVLFPGLRGRVRRLGARWTAPAHRGLSLDRRDEAPPAGTHWGFTTEEMAVIVAEQLENVGLTGRLAPLVIVLGHGGSTVNNPHESAYQCGACGGGRGGANARVFVTMANDPRVRARLADRGIEIPSGTWFVSGERDTTDDSITLHDLARVPTAHAQALVRMRRRLDAAALRDAHERCRRFSSIALGARAVEALRHVQARALDMSQPRPEYGHATNAFCVVGRRAITRGIFLDRRAFLATYDPTLDEGGDVLVRLLESIVPVVAGINLEYYFSFVDPMKHGAGTKLPHNVTALLGVMDGAESDLRTGLPAQMVEIHEPVRLTLLIEADAGRIEAVLVRAPTTRRLVAGRWIMLARIDPVSGEIDEWVDGHFVRQTIQPGERRAGESEAVYRHSREDLPFIRLDGPSHLSRSGTR